MLCLTSTKKSFALFCLKLYKLFHLKDCLSHFHLFMVKALKINWPFVHKQPYHLILRTKEQLNATSGRRGQRSVIHYFTDLSNGFHKATQQYSSGCSPYTALSQLQESVSGSTNWSLGFAFFLQPLLQTVGMTVASRCYFFMYHHVFKIYLQISIECKNNFLEGMADALWVLM